MRMDRCSGFQDVNYGVSQDEILFWPCSDDVNLDCLERLLAQAHNKGLSPKDRLEFFRHVRVTEPDAPFPAYDNIRESAPVSKLRRLYNELTGNEFDINDLSNHVNDAVYAFMINPKTGESFVVDVGS